MMNSSSSDIKAEMASSDICCASCGITEVDDVTLTLTECDGCDLVRYCSDECQANHKSEHEAKCKERAAELRDVLLLKQPESTHLGDCPICMLPLPVDHDKYVMFNCCSKIICNGCAMASFACRGRSFEQLIGSTCPFCRERVARTQEEKDRNTLKRIEAKDPVAMRDMGNVYFNKGDYGKAYKCLSQAADLGDAEAHFRLSILYENGQGFEKDEEKGLYHLEEAAISGHPAARIGLSRYELERNRHDRAIKHWIIAANLGDDFSIKMLKLGYKHGKVSKEDFAAALRAHKTAVDAMKSPERDLADAKSWS